MSTKMLIDAAHDEETRVVVLKGKSLEEFDFETSTKQQIKGNIYLAKVTRVEPSLQAAFVDYGGNRHGFLAFSEIHPDYYQIPIADREALIQGEGGEADGNGVKANGEAKNSGDEGGNGSVETVSGEEIDEISRRPPIHQRYRIQEVIKRRQIMLVQVAKEERGTKGAALTTFISLAGRYCVLMPNTTRGGGISRKIQSGEARKRLRAVVSALNLPDGMAVILRTAGQERSKAEIKRDYEYLVRVWDTIRELTMTSTAPAPIFEEANLIRRSIRDLYRPDIEEILVEGDAGYRVAKEFMRTLMPSRAKLVQPYRDALPLFQRFQVESQLDAMHSDTVQLRSGGYIVINPTEALVAIDVNSGRATKERNIEETATKTNLEAAEEVARQLRLRDLAGLIVIDFIDMEESRNCRAVEKRLKEAVRSDRARIQMGRISPFGLLELSRQRLRPSLIEASSEICATCHGLGRVRSVESTALQALRAAEEESLRDRADELCLSVPTPVALYLLNNKRTLLSEIETRYKLQIRIAADDALAPPGIKVEVLAPRTTDAPDAVEAKETADKMVAEAEPEKDGEGRRRRSRRRRGRASGESETSTEKPVEAKGNKDADAEGEAPGEDRAPQHSADGDGEPGRRRRRGRRGGRRRGRGREVQATADISDDSAESPVEPRTAVADQPETAEPSTAAADQPETAEPSTAIADQSEPVAPAPTDNEQFASKPTPEDKPATTAPKAPRRRGRRRPAPKAEASLAATEDTKSQTVAAGGETTDQAGPTEVAAGTGDGDAGPKPRRRRAAAGSKDDAKAAKPRRTPRRRSKATTNDAPPPPDTPAGPDAATRQPEVVPSQQPAASGNGNGGEADQRLTDDAPTLPETTPALPGDSDGQPRRRGWWQRITGA